MSSQEDQENQPPLFMDDDNRLVRLEGLSAESHEQIADLLILLRRGMVKEDCGPKGVQAELDRFTELMFRDYKAIACKDAADIFSARPLRSIYVTARQHTKMIRQKDKWTNEKAELLTHLMPSVFD